MTRPDFVALSQLPSAYRRASRALEERRAAHEGNGAGMPTPALALFSGTEEHDSLTAAAPPLVRDAHEPVEVPAFRRVPGARMHDESPVARRKRESE